MRLIQRSRHQRRGKVPRIAINQEEITADLHYPASRRAAQRLGATGATRSGGR
jgi:hypothetical protein